MNELKNEESKKALYLCLNFSVKKLPNKLHDTLCFSFIFSYCQIGPNSDSKQNKKYFKMFLKENLHRENSRNSIHFNGRYTGGCFYKTQLAESW